MSQGPYHLGLIGYPLGHSRSPQLHHAALRHYGLAGEYSLFPIPPLPEGEAQIVALLGRLRRGDLHGLNVTIPHKPSAVPHVDRLSEVARAVGAVNTLYLDGEGRLVGDNTDAPGFLEDVGRLPDLERGIAIVLGAGGSARAVVYGLAREGWQVKLLARRVEQAAGLVEDLRALKEAPSGSLECGRLDAETVGRYARECRLVVNTTPVGMYPNMDASPWPEGAPWPQAAGVYDLVYNPPETVFTRQARQAGLATRTGGGMLSAQAALAFACWTGQAPPFEVMYREMYHLKK